MADQLLRAEDAAAFYHQAANSYKLAKSWELAAVAYSNSAACHLRMGSKDEAASSYADAASCYKKISPEKAISSLEQAVGLSSESGTFNMAARYCKVELQKVGISRGLSSASLEHGVSLATSSSSQDRVWSVAIQPSSDRAMSGIHKEVGELYEQGNNLEQAIAYFGQAAGLFQGEELTPTAVQCRQKVAQLSAQLQRYIKAAETFEDIAGHSFRNSSLRYAVRGNLLNAGICHLCKGNTAASRNALEHYKDIDPSFSRTREHKLLADLAGAVDEGNVENFTDILKEYDSLSPLGIWRTTMLLRVKEALKAKSVGGANLR